jgi:hypothetical protein
MNGSSFPDNEKEVLRTNTEAIQTDVELKLREAGLRVLTVTELAHTPGNPIFQIRIAEYSGATHVVAELFEHVFLTRNDGIEVQAIIWREDGLGTPSNIREIREFIKDKVDQFLNAWLTANPKQR